MSRVDDNNSDAQRIREMKEADLRRKQDDQKRLQKKATERSFQQVMKERQQRDKTHRELAHQDRARTEGAADERRQAGESVLSHVRRHAPRRERELARRAGLAHSAQAGLHKRAARAVEESEAAEAHRAAELLARTGDERETVQEMGREEEEQAFDSREERQAEVEQAARDGGPIDADGRRNRQDRGDQQGRRDEPRSEVAAVAAAQGKGGAAPVLPAAIIQRLVSAIYKAATADGRTHLVLELKGGPLDGVRLAVSSENGQVRCTLSGCEGELAKSLERAQPSLARGLSRRGLKLAELTVERR